MSNAQLANALSYGYWMFLSTYDVKVVGKVVFYRVGWQQPYTVVCSSAQEALEMGMNILLF